MLQGSLEDFALEEILSLLADTTKSGQLDVNGDRGSGALVMCEGKLAGARASKCEANASQEDVMFELLRFSEGSFVFSNQNFEPTGDEKDIAGVLTIAEGRLIDWKAIAAVVPSLDHIVAPCRELPSDEITIDRSEWAVLGVVSNGARAGDVCDVLDLGEVEGCRKIKQLAERGLIELLDPNANPAAEAIFPDEPVAQAGSFEPTEEIGVLSTPEVGSSADQDPYATPLRGGAVDTNDGTPPIPPNQLAENGAVATADPLADESGDGEGLLMRYLRGEED